MKEGTSQSRYWVPMVGHAFRALEAFSDADMELGLQEVSSRAGISKSSAFRILFTLENLGYVTKNPASGKYQLGLKILEAARRARSGRNLVQIARPYMNHLLDRFGETVNLAIFQDGDVVYVEILEGRQAFRMTGDVGARAPLHASAIGKAIAASLPENTIRTLLEEYRMTRLTPRTITSREQYLRELAKIRSRGYSLDEEEVERGAMCVAVPIPGDGLHAEQALSVSGPTHRIRANLKAIVRELTKACSSISQKLQP